MKQKYLILLTLIIFLGTVFGCSPKKERFDDRNITIDVVDTEATIDYKSYTIEITNKTGYELTHLTFNLSYRIRTPNGTKSNPFSVEGKTDSLRPINLKPGETIAFSIFAPIKDVFADLDTLDFENPNIELKGYYINEEKEEIQFGMSGGLRVFDDNF